MKDVLFVGTGQNIEIDAVLHRVSETAAQLGIKVGIKDFKIYRIESGTRKQNEECFLNNHSLIEIFFKDNPNWIIVTQFENEIHPGYSVVTEPLLVGVSVWVGADVICKAMAASVAAAVAAQAGSKISDSEHLWSDQELNHPCEFLEKVKAKMKGSP